MVKRKSHEKGISLSRTEKLLIVGGAIGAAASFAAVFKGRISADRLQEEVASLMPSPEALSGLSDDDRELITAQTRQMLEGQGE